MRRPWVILALVGILFGMVACGQGSIPSSQSIRPASPHSSRSGPRIADTIRIGSPGWTTAGAGYVWYSGNDGSLWRIDPATNKPVGQGILCSMGMRTIGFGSLWAYANNGNACRPGSTYDWRVWRIDPSTGRMLSEIPITPKSAYSMHYLAVGESAVWARVWTEIGTGDNGQGLPGFLDRIDPSSNRVTGSVGLGSKDDGAVAAGLGSVWVTNAPKSKPGRLLRIDPRTLQVTGQTRIGRNADDVAIGFGSVWVSNFGDSTVMRVDPVSARVVASVRVQQGAGLLSIGEGAIWISDDQKGVLSEIDPATNLVKAELPMGQPAYVFAVAFGSVWMAAAEEPTIWRIDPGS